MRIRDRSQSAQASISSPLLISHEMLQTLVLMNASLPRILTRLTVLSALIVSSVTAQSAAPAGWPNWRGPNGNGSITTGEYPTKWDASRVAWKVALPGKGTSTPIVHDGCVYVTSPDNGEDTVLAFDLTGKELWRTKLGSAVSPKHRTLASSSNASPVTDGKGLFVYFKSGHFAALELDGKVRWKTNIVERFGRDELFWDQGSSPVVTDTHVVLARMHSGESWLAGFDKATGELRWQQPRNYKVPNENDNGYATPVAFQHAGNPALLLWGADHLTAHNAADGKVLWSVGGFNPDSTGLWPGIATPVISGNMAVVPVGRDDRNQARLHGIRLGGEGDVTETHRVWKRDDLGVFVASPVAYDGRVYLLRHRGGVVCLNPTNGDTIWAANLPEHRTPYYASPMIANGLLYAAREDGTVFVARVGEKFEMLSENVLGERIVASPVAAAGRLFFRGDGHLFCVAGE
jgi:outer membrane protein assembly factor BamB